MSRFAQNLSKAFELVEELKKESDNRKFLYTDGDDTDDDDIALEDGDCAVILPLLGALIGPDTFDNNKLADLAGVKFGSKQKFNEGMQKFLKDIKELEDVKLEDSGEPVEKKEKSFFDNLFLGKFINKKTVALLTVTLGFLCWWYKNFTSKIPL